MSGNRTERLASVTKEELSEMFSRKTLKELKDNRFQGMISITDVKVEKGYHHFRIFLSVWEENLKEGVLEVLNEASSAIRGELCRRLKLRVAPTITFHMDDSLKRGLRVCEILDKIKHSNEDN